MPLARSIALGLDRKHRHICTAANVAMQFVGIAEIKPFYGEYLVLTAFLKNGHPSAGPAGFTEQFIIRPVTAHGPHHWPQKIFASGRH